MSASIKDIQQRKQDHIWYHGDCLELLRALPDNSAELVLTSPPYALKKEYEAGTELETLLSFQETVAEECFRILKPNGSICWQIGTYIQNEEAIPLDILLYKFFRRHGLKLRNRIVWHFEHGMHARNKLSGRYETIMWFTKSDNYVFNLDQIRVPQKQPNKRFYKGPRKGEISSNPLGKNPGDVWIIPNVKHGHPEKVPDGHPCQFPIELAERCIRAFTNPGQMVVDPFGGLATTLIAALRQGRIGVGAELQREYFLLGKQRIRELKNGTLQVKSKYLPTLLRGSKLLKKSIAEL